MRFIVAFFRIIVGVLFIISGFIKLNDPVGFSFKLGEYFAPSVLNLDFLTPYSLAIAIFVVTAEVLLGVFLLLGIHKRFTMVSLLGMILFFTFLTFYSAYFNKVTDCGCFGDALHLTPWQSFTKDIILLFFISVLFLYQHYITPLFSKKANATLEIFSLLGCVLFTYYVLAHLPAIDFRAYKVGTHIPSGMRIPKDAPKPIFEYQWKFKVDNQEKTITNTGAYPSIDGDFIGVQTKEIQKGYEPPIHDFTIEKNGTDYAATILQDPKVLMVVAYALEKTDTTAFKAIGDLAHKALTKGYKVIGVSASSNKQTAALVTQYNLPFSFYFTDQTTLKTIIRANPGILVLEKGTITQKWHYNDIASVKLK